MAEQNKKGFWRTIAETLAPSSAAGEGMVQMKDRVDAYEKKKKEQEEQSKIKEEVKKPGLKDVIEPKEEEIVEQPIKIAEAVKKKEEKKAKPEVVIDKGGRQTEKKKLAEDSSNMINSITTAAKGQDTIKAIGSFEDIAKDYIESTGYKPDPYVKSLKSKLIEIKKKAQADKDDVRKMAAWMGVAETIGQGLVKWGMSKYGEKHGVDVSGNEYRPTDWNKKLQGQIDSINEKMQIAEEEVGQELIGKDKEREELIKEKGILKTAQEKDLRESLKPEEDKDDKKDTFERQKELIKLKHENAKELADLKQEAKNKGTKLSTGEIDSLAQFGDALNAIDLAGKWKTTEDIDTGPISNARNWLAGKVGMDDPKVTKLKQMLSDVLAKKVKTLSGAAASDKERAFLKFTLPNMEQNDKTFLMSLQNAADGLKNARTERMKVYKAAGRDVSGFEQDKEQEVPKETRKEKLIRLRKKKAQGK